MSVRPEAQRRLYSLRVDPLIELDAWLEPYRQMWRTSLDKLEKHVTKSKPAAPRR